MKVKFIALVALVGLVAMFGVPAHAGVTFGSSASHPNLQLENFEALNVSGIRACAAPAPPATDCAPPGALKAGAVYDTAGFGFHELAAYSAGVFGSSSKGWVADFFVESFEIDFNAPGVASWGANLVDFFSSQGCIVDVYDAGGLIGSTTSTCDPAGSSYLSAEASGTTIRKIVITAPNNFFDGAEGPDNMSFGTETKLVAHPAILDTSGPSVNLTLSATLTDLAGAPVAGETVKFTAGSSTCSGVTNASGLASCGGIPEIVATLPGGTYTAAHAATYPWGASSGTGGLIG